MKKTQTLFTLTAALMLASAPVFAADVSATTKTEYNEGDHGSYETKKVTEKETADGTSIKNQSAVSVEKDEDGNYKKVIEHKTTTDPKGLMNKTTVKTEEVIINDEDKNEHSLKKVVDGETVIDEKSVEEKQ